MELDGLKDSIVVRAGEIFRQCHTMENDPHNEYLTWEECILWGEPDHPYYNVCYENMRAECITKALAELN